MVIPQPVVIPQPGVQRCINLHLYTQEGHQEAVQSDVARQRIQSSGTQLSASMASFMAVVALTANPLWYMVSVLVVLATRPPITASAGYAGTALGTQSLGAACHCGVGARRRDVRTTLWRASQALRPGIPVPAGALSFRARSPTTRESAVYTSPSPEPAPSRRGWGGRPLA